MILLSELSDTKPGRIKGVPTYTTAALGVNEGKVRLARLRQEQQTQVTAAAEPRR